MKILLKLEFYRDSVETVKVVQTEMEYVDINDIDWDTFNSLYQILKKDINYIKAYLGG